VASTSRHPARGAQQNSSTTNTITVDYQNPSKEQCTAGVARRLTGEPTKRHYRTYRQACQAYLAGSSGGGSGTQPASAQQVAKMPRGSVDAGGGASAGTVDPWLLGLGGGAILTGAGAAAAAGSRLRRR
jgi:hypothetical protein